MQAGQTHLWSGAVQHSGYQADRGCFTAMAGKTWDLVLKHAPRVREASFIREGTYADGTVFEMIGFTQGNTGMVVESLYLNAEPPTPDERTLVNAVECAAHLGEMRLECS